jgi:hypothetical protein
MDSTIDSDHASAEPIPEKNDETSGLHGQGGDADFGSRVEVERILISPSELDRVGYQSVEGLLRAELSNSQGANGGYNTGVNAKESLNIGLSNAGRKKFRDARKKAVADYLAGDLIGSLSKID